MVEMKKIIFITCIAILSCSPGHKTEIVNAIGQDEYARLMTSSIDLFDQSSEGFRQYSDNYALVSLLIPEYIEVNQLSDEESRNLHWHMGQIHAFNGYEQEAIAEMKQSYAGGSITWKCYVDGSIAFLQQDNQMNIEILEKFVKYFDKSYMEAYSAEY